MSIQYIKYRFLVVHNLNFIKHPYFNKFWRRYAELSGIWNSDSNNTHTEWAKAVLKTKHQKKRKKRDAHTQRGARKISEIKSKEKMICSTGLPIPPSLYLHYLKQRSGLHGPGWGEWGWMGFELGPGKGLMTRVWTNGSQWSCLLIQPQYFRSIKYVCPYHSRPPTPTSTPKVRMQVNNMLIRRGAWDCFSSPPSLTLLSHWSKHLGKTCDSH